MKFNLSHNHSPKNNFYEYVNEKWLRNTIIPSDHQRWGVFNKLFDDNLKNIRKLLEFYLNSNDVEFKKVIILYEQAVNNFRNTEAALPELPKGYEIANSCLFLASDLASAITGQCINVDCGVFPQ